MLAARTRRQAFDVRRKHAAVKKRKFAGTEFGTDQRKYTATPRRHALKHKAATEEGAIGKLNDIIRYAQILWAQIAGMRFSDEGIVMIA